MILKPIKNYLFALLFLGCTDSRIIVELQKSKDVFKEEYEIDIHSHFPTEFNAGNVIFAHFERPDSFIHFGYTIVAMHVSNDEIERIKSSGLQGKDYKDPNFSLITIDLVVQCEDFDSLRQYDSTIPIVDLNTVNFNMGKIPDSTFVPAFGGYAPVDKYVVPDDLKIFVIKYDIGNFWKDANIESRCSLIEEMKNGYSYGYAISESNNYVAYWAIAW